MTGLWEGRAESVFRPSLGWVLAALLTMALLGTHTVRRPWIGDFWEHAAVVRELSAHPCDPAHPVYSLETGHEFYSPYALSIALAGRSLRLDASSALTAAAVLLLPAYVFATRLMAFRFAEKEKEGAAILFLLLSLFLWGLDPWRYGGFSSLGALSYCLAYPATASLVFAMAASYVGPEVLRRGEAGYAILMGVTGAFVFISHPFSIALLFGLAVAGCFAEGFAPRRVLRPTAVAGAMALVAAWTWPYFDVAALLRSGSVFAESNNRLYEDVVRRGYPLLLAIPSWVRSLKSERQRALGLVALLLTGVYATGAILRDGNLGRSLSGLAMILHLLIATDAARTFARPEPGCRFGGMPLAGWLLAGLAFGVAYRPQLRPLVGRIISGQARSEQRVVDEMCAFIGDRGVIAGDQGVSWRLVGTCGRVLFAHHPQAFVADADLRKTANRALSRSDCGGDQGIAYAQIFDVQFIVKTTRKESVESEAMEMHDACGVRIFEDQGMALFRVRRERKRETKAFR